MKILAASANKEELIIAKSFGAYGIITNPTLIALEKKPWRIVIEESAKVINGPYHLQTTEKDLKNIKEQINIFHSILGDRLIVKACISKQNLSLINELHEQNFKVNITGIVSIPQALVAIQAKADFISIYLGRADKIGGDGVNIVRTSSEMINQKNYTCEIIAASVKDPMHYIHAALAGADWIACPIPLMNMLIDHPVTTMSIKRFDEDWGSIPKS